MPHRRWWTYSSVTLHVHNFQRRTIIAWIIEDRRVGITTSKAHWRSRRFPSRPCWQATFCVFTIVFARVVRYRKFGTYTEKIEEEENRRPPRAVDHTRATRAEHATSSRRLDAKSHCESRNVDAQGFRTGRICQNGGNWTVLYHQRLWHKWKQFYSFMQRILIAEEFSMFKVTST